MRIAYKCVLTLSLGLLVFVTISKAQFKNGSQATELNIPRVSQHASVEQTIGISTIRIDYHRPAAGGREILGKTVPYGKVWRAGANDDPLLQKLDSKTDINK